MIDLTNTDRYYDKECFENVNVKHIKMIFKGHSLPTEDYIQNFIKTITDIEKDLKQNEYIGVHCTHGINRTGYLMIWYLC